MSDTLEYLKLGATFISGGLAGALVNFFTSRRRQRVEMGLKLAERYFADFDSIAEGKDLLGDAARLREVGNQNKVRKLGDWFELIAILSDSKYVSDKFLKECGLEQEMRKFHELVTVRKSEPGSSFNDAWLWWPRFDAFVNKAKKAR